LNSDAIKFTIIPTHYSSNWISSFSRCYHIL